MSNGNDDGSDDFGRPEPSHHSLPLHPAWEANSAFGLVHPYGCKTCCKYMSHVVAASHVPEDHSFHSAIKTRDSLATMRYLEGIREGRHIQKESDDRHVNRYWEQRDQAVALSVQREDEIEFLREELAELRDRLFSMQVMFEVMSGSDTSDSGSMESLDLQESLYSSTTAAHRSDSALALHPNIRAFEQDEGAKRHAKVEGEKEEEEEEEEEERHDTKDVSVAPASPLVAHTHLDEDSDSDTDTSWSISSPGSIDILLSEPETPSPQVATVPDEFEDLTSVTVHAHELEHSKTMKSVHGVPPPDTPLISEIFVDASNSGIGFMFGRQWLAWQLKDGWRSEKRDINWAEMVAVELGIRAMISAGHRSSVLRVWSDNDTVVRALIRRTSKKPELKLILREIVGLCEAFSIKLAVDWVWTKSNPADGPSRGVYPPKDLLFEQHPPLPTHLFPFVSAVN